MPVGVQRRFELRWHYGCGRHLGVAVYVRHKLWPLKQIGRIKKPTFAGFSKLTAQLEAMHRASLQGGGETVSHPLPQSPTKSSNQCKYTTKMYNCSSKIAFRLNLNHNQLTIRSFFELLRSLRTAGLLVGGLVFVSSLPAQTLELRGIQPDYPMLRNGIPLLVDGETVRIAGAEFQFHIAPAGRDSLVRKTADGRIFTAVGTCAADAASGYRCALIDTAGNPQNYLLTASADTVGVWLCVGRHSEPSFPVHKVN